MVPLEAHIIMILLRYSHIRNEENWVSHYWSYWKHSFSRKLSSLRSETTKAHFCELIIYAPHSAVWIESCEFGFRLIKSLSTDNIFRSKLMWLKVENWVLKSLALYLRDCSTVTLSYSYSILRYWFLHMKTPLHWCNSYHVHLGIVAFIQY